MAENTEAGADSEKKEVISSDVKVAALGLVPKLAWIAFALVALLMFWAPAKRLLDEGLISKIGIGIVQIEIAQKAVSHIQDGDRSGVPKTMAAFKPIADRAKMIESKLVGSFILWVDDKNPSQNVLERRAFESFGIHFDLASSTEEAFKWLDRAHYDAVISNINRPEEATNNVPCFTEPRSAGAGCAMVKQMHDQYGEAMPPVIFYSARYPQSAGIPPFALGVTNRVDKLFDLVFDALERRKDPPGTDEHDS